MSSDLAGRVALVTGGASGIGRATAEALGARGAAEPRGGLGECGGDLVFRGVQGGAGFAPCLGRKRSQAAHQLGQAAAPAQRRDPDRLERLGRSGFGDLAQDLVAQPVNLFHRAIPKNKGAVNTAPPSTTHSAGPQPSGPSKSLTH